MFVMMITLNSATAVSLPGLTQRVLVYFQNTNPCTWSNRTRHFDAQAKPRIAGISFKSSSIMELQKASGFLKNAYYQGHGRYVNQIARLTIKFCKSAGSCREMRKFIETKLVDTAKDNTGCVIYVKPRLFKAPVMQAEYLNGQTHHVSLYLMSSAQIEAWVSWFLTRSGFELHRMNRPITTYRPSIQGIWTPFMFKDPKLNMAEFPSKKYGRYIAPTPSATEQVLHLYSKQKATMDTSGSVGSSEQSSDTPQNIVYDDTGDEENERASSGKH